MDVPIAQAGMSGGVAGPKVGRRGRRGRWSRALFLQCALLLAQGRPVLLAGGIAESADTRAALGAGAAAVVGTRFPRTHESGAHPEYQQRIRDARTTVTTTLFGFGWPARHRVIPNAATQRWCRADGSTERVSAFRNARSARLASIPAPPAAVLRTQRAKSSTTSPEPPRESLDYAGRVARLWCLGMLKGRSYEYPGVPGRISDQLNPTGVDSMIKPRSG